MATTRKSRKTRSNASNQDGIQTLRQIEQSMQEAGDLLSVIPEVSELHFRDRTMVDDGIDSFFPRLNLGHMHVAGNREQLFAFLLSEEAGGEIYFYRFTGSPRRMQFVNFEDIVVDGLDHPFDKTRNGHNELTILCHYYFLAGHYFGTHKIDSRFTDRLRSCLEHISLFQEGDGQDNMGLEDRTQPEDAAALEVAAQDDDAQSHSPTPISLSDARDSWYMNAAAAVTSSLLNFARPGMTPAPTTVDSDPLRVSQRGTVALSNSTSSPTEGGAESTPNEGVRRPSDRSDRASASSQSIATTQVSRYLGSSPTPNGIVSATAYKSTRHDQIPISTPQSKIRQSQNCTVGMASLRKEEPGSKRKTDTVHRDEDEHKSQKKARGAWEKHEGQEKRILKMQSAVIEATANKEAAQTKREAQAKKVATAQVRLNNIQSKFQDVHKNLKDALNELGKIDSNIAMYTAEEEKGRKILDRITKEIRRDRLQDETDTNF